MSHVTYGYDDRLLFDNVNFQVASGELLHLRGPNGSGKTTLLKLLAGLIQPLEGKISYQGESIHKQLNVYQQSITYLGHKNAIHALLTIRENCQFFLNHALNNVQLDLLLEAWDLIHDADVPCELLSAGQRRRVGLLRLFLGDAPIWLLDEPFVALDEKSIHLLGECFQRHLAQKGSIVLTSHQKLPLNAHQYQEYDLLFNISGTKLSENFS